MFNIWELGSSQSYSFRRESAGLSLASSLHPPPQEFWINITFTNSTSREHIKGILLTLVFLIFPCLTCKCKSCIFLDKFQPNVSSLHPPWPGLSGRWILAGIRVDSRARQSWPSQEKRPWSEPAVKQVCCFERPRCPHKKLLGIVRQNKTICN